MKRLLNALTVIVALGLLPGCAVTLHGNQSTGPGGTASSTGSSLQAGKQFGNTRVAGSGASVVLVAGLVMIELADAVSEWFRPAAPRAERLPGNISQTCSCYGDAEVIQTTASQP
jgi:hypothetical protein